MFDRLHHTLSLHSRPQLTSLCYNRAMAASTGYHIVATTLSHLSTDTASFYTTVTSTSTILSFVTSTASMTINPYTTSNSEPPATYSQDPTLDERTPHIVAMVLGIPVAVVVGCMLIFYLGCGLICCIGCFKKMPDLEHQDRIELEAGPISSPTSRARLRHLLEQRRMESIPTHAYGGDSGPENGELATSNETLPKYSGSMEGNEVTNAPGPVYGIDHQRRSRRVVA